MGGSSSQTIGQRYFAKLTTFIGNPIEKLIGINFDNRGWIFKPDNDESFLRVESPNLYGDKEGGVAGFIDIHTGTADQLPNSTYEKDFPKVSGYPFQSYLLFRGLGRGVSAGGVIGEIAGIIAKRHHYNKSFYHGNSGYMKEMLLWPQRVHVRNDGRPQWYDSKAAIFAGTIKGVQGGVNRFALILDNSGSMSGSKLNALKAALENLASSIESGVVAISQMMITIFSSSHESFYAANKNECLVILTRAISALNASGSSTNAVHALADVPAYLTNPVTSDLVVIVSDGEMSEVGEAQQNIASVSSIVKIAGVGVGTIGSLASFHNMEHEIPIVQGESTQITDAILYVISKIQVSYFDINPIHKIREILTDDTAMNKPESDINDVNFKKAADVLYTEKLGISWSVTEKSCLEAINELCGHIEAGVRMNRQTGLYEMVLFRDDWFAENEVHTLPVNKIKGMQLDGATSADELINKLNVSYYNREAIKNSSFSVAENAAIRNLNGHENSEDVKFPYFMNQRNAAIVSQWKLKQVSTPIWQGTFTTGFYQARKWNRYDLLKLEWPRRWSGTILVRIMKINLGTSTDVSIDFVEVVPYSGNLSSNIVNDTPVDTTPKPPQPALFKAFELSYLEAVQLNGQKAVDEALAYNPDAGYAAVIAQRPQSNSLSALMYTDTGNDYERVGAIAYSETAELDQSILKTDTAFIVKQAGDIDMVSIGTQITVNHEIMVYQAYDEETGLLTVKRGALDTIPQNHVAGSVLYFADDFITVDPTEYVTGEIINVKTLTTTPSGILNLDDVDAQQVEIKARANRPYPPANVKINSEYWPAYFEDDFTLTWSNRNRLQQTGGLSIGYFDSSVALEENTQTLLTVIELDANDVELATHSVNVTASNSFTLLESAMQADTRSLDINLKTVREGYECMNVFDHIVKRSTLIAPSNVTFEVIEY
ncbi:MAG TPA: hypothetical protein DCM65_09555 [Acinetobacter junii]|nr:hypothetical protein [Acinetobacter junii]